MWARLLKLDEQYRRPSGWIGRWVGHKMVAQHRSENLWTLEQLDIQPTDRVLEVGFGPGYAIQQIASRLTRGLIAGVDFSETMVQAANQRNAQAVKDSRVELHCADVTALPFADGWFDKVFSINSLYFWQQPRAAFRELARVLKPNGLLVLTFLPVERWTDAPPATDAFRPYSAVEVQALLTEVGFVDLCAEGDPDLRNRSNFSVMARKASPPAE